ncbi:MAG: class I SAM-dependent methyltransferase [Candidatus Aminicenantes bacterium]|nr:class I SAM-dependent methyltransferase [Candidatus Aminicenantes bacterium]
MMSRKEFFENVAYEWEQEHSGADSHQRLLELVERFDLQPGDKVLDAGCGTGRLVPYLLKAVGQTGLVVAADFASQMIEIARKKYSAPNLMFLQADVMEMPIADNFFDRIILLALFPHLPEKARALKEFYRLLKPVGQLFIAHTSGREEINDFHARLVYPLCEDFLPEEEQMRKLILSANFEILEFVDDSNLYFVACRKK